LQNEINELKKREESLRIEMQRQNSIVTDNYSYGELSRSKDTLKRADSTVSAT
jgi:hypothetical protein